jgi:alkyl sulfatase BDS1-like metallo-beta-lactamase superfamily hydrolase
MYGTRLPRSPRGLVDEGLGKALATGRVGILPPSRLVTRTGEELTLDGVRFVFQMVPGSEAPAELTFLLPERKAWCGAELVSQTLHNLYTLRGARVRDALRWSGYLDEALDRVAGAGVEVYFGSHHWPVWGRERIAAFVATQRDVYRYIHDQTVRMMNAGMGPREIADQLRLPRALDAFLHAHGYYGTVRHNARAVYQFYLGFYDANPASLDPLPRTEVGRRYVELAGGAERVLATAQAAYDRADYRWAAELLSHLVYADPDQEAGKALLARTFDQLGYAAESASWRNAYLTGALELRGGPPTEGLARSRLLDMLAHTPVERFLEAMAAALDGPKAEGVNLTVNLVFTDTGESFVLRIDSAVLHHRRGPPAPAASSTLRITRPLFLRMMTGTAGLRDTLLSDDLQVIGSRLDLVRFFSLLDRFPGTFPVVTAR